MPDRRFRQVVRAAIVYCGRTGIVLVNRADGTPSPEPGVNIIVIFDVASIYDTIIYG
jgi:hypothetical protein